MGARLDDNSQAEHAKVIALPEVDDVAELLVGAKPLVGGVGEDLGEKLDVHRSGALVQSRL